MKELKALSEELLKKDSDIRQGFFMFLNRWKEETSDCLKNWDLELVKVLVKNEMTYFLARGNDRLLCIEEDGWRGYNEKRQVYNESWAVPISDINFSVLSEIVNNLPNALEKYISRLESAGAEYDGVRWLLDGFIK